MDPDSCEETHKKYEDINNRVDGGDVLQPAWVRCAFRPCDEVDRFLLDYGRYFLLPIGVVLWCLLLVAQV
jgi:hypothetical protein